jgi:hypothetical protein
MIGVNWSKDIDQILAAAKEQFSPHLAGLQRGSGLRSHRISSAQRESICYPPGNSDPGREVFCNRD